MLRRFLALFFFLAGGILLLISVGSLTAAMLVRGATDLPDRFAWKPPMDLVENRALEPATVLLPLTGADARQALNISLERGHWENALALIAYDPDVDPVWLMTLGDRFAARRQMSKAAGCYQMRARLAILDGRSSDVARLDALLNAAAGLRAAGASDAARFAVDQADLIAQYGTSLYSSLREYWFGKIAEGYDAFGASERAAQARSKAGATSILRAREFFTPVNGALPASPELNQAIQTRIAAAQELAATLEAQTPARVEWNSDLVSQLSDALMQEDATRRVYFETELAKTSDIFAQAGLRRERVRWLALRYRIARGAFGAPLVAEWTRDADAIRQALSDAWLDLFDAYQAQIQSAYSDAGDQTRARETLARDELIAIRWGWVRADAELDLRAGLDELNQKLRAENGSGLFLDRVAQNNRALDILVPDEYYGQAEQALK